MKRTGRREKTEKKRQGKERSGSRERAAGKRERREKRQGTEMREGKKKRQGREMREGKKKRKGREMREGKKKRQGREMREGKKKRQGREMREGKKNRQGREMREGKKNRQGRENRQHLTAGEEGKEGELGQTNKPKSKTAGGEKQSQRNRKGKAKPHDERFCLVFASGGYSILPPDWANLIGSCDWSPQQDRVSPARRPICQKPSRVQTKLAEDSARFPLSRKDKRLVSLTRVTCCVVLSQ